MMLPEITLIECDDGTCKIKADNTMNGGEVKILPVKASQYEMLEGMLAYNRGDGKIQDCFPFLEPGEREFMLSGLTPNEFDRMFNESQMGTSDKQE